MSTIPSRLASTSPPAEILVNPFFSRIFKTLTHGRKPDREKCALIFLDVTWLHLNQKVAPSTNPGVSRVSPDPAALEKFGCGCFSSVSSRPFPRYLGFLRSAPVSFRMVLISFQIALFSFQMMLKTFHFRLRFLSVADILCYPLVWTYFSVDNYVDKMWIT